MMPWSPARTAQRCELSQVRSRWTPSASWAHCTPYQVLAHPLALGWVHNSFQPWRRLGVHLERLLKDLADLDVPVRLNFGDGGGEAVEVLLGDGEEGLDLVVVRLDACSRVATRRARAVRRDSSRGLRCMCPAITRPPTRQVDWDAGETRFVEAQSLKGEQPRESVLLH